MRCHIKYHENAMQCADVAINGALWLHHHYNSTRQPDMYNYTPRFHNKDLYCQMGSSTERNSLESGTPYSLSIIIMCNVH